MLRVIPNTSSWFDMMAPVRISIARVLVATNHVNLSTPEDVESQQKIKDGRARSSESVSKQIRSEKVNYEHINVCRSTLLLIHLLCSGQIATLNSQPTRWWKLISAMWNFIVRSPQRMICAMFDNQLLAHPRRAGCCWFYDFEYLIPANSTWLDIYHFPNCLAFHIVFAQSQFLPG